MNSFDNFIIYFGYFLIISFFLAIIGFACLLIGKNSLDKSKFYYKLGAILMIQLLITAILFFFFHARFANNLRFQISKITKNKELQLYINNVQINNSLKDSLILELSNIRNVMTNHTGPSSEINLVLKSDSLKINLLLGRDSGDSSLYWVFVKNFITSTNNDIGKIRTKLLNNY